MDKIKFLSLIVPAYRQETTIQQNIHSLYTALQSLSIPFEIIIIVDGFIDNTYDQAKQIKKNQVKIFGYKDNMGKGFAIRYGVKKAHGDIIGFIDADMDIDPTGISMLLNHMIWYDADIIVGSKLHPVSRVDYPVVRKLLSWVYRVFTHFLFGFTVRDTQVGLKLFKSSVAKKVFPMLLVNRFAFDIELLAVSYKLGYRRIYEAPIKLRFNSDSSIPHINSDAFWIIIFNILKDTFLIYYRLRIARSYKS